MSTTPTIPVSVDFLEEVKSIVNGYRFSGQCGPDLVPCITMVDMIDEMIEMAHRQYDLEHVFQKQDAVEPLR